MDLKRLKYFCAVVESGNISHAAHHLNISQPPLSKRLQELEEEVGVALHKRSGGKVEATEAGLFLYRRANAVLKQIAGLEADTLRFAAGEKRKVSIGLTHLYQRYFQDLIVELVKRHPDIEFRTVVSDSSHLEELLHNGELDVALVQRPHKMADYDLIPLPPVRAVVVANRKLAEGCADGRADLDCLGRFPLIFLRRINGHGTFEFLLDKMRKNGVQPNVLMNITQPHLIINMLSGGVEAAALLPESEILGECLDNCTLLYPTPEMLVFYPCLIRLPAHSEIPEITALVEELFLHGGAGEE